MYLKLAALGVAALLLSACDDFETVTRADNSAAPVNGKCPAGYQLVRLSIGGMTCRPNL